MEHPTIDSLITTQHAGIHCKLDHFLATGKIPNIIFHGSAGTGKKTIVFNFLHKIYGNAEGSNISHKELIGILKNNVMSVNCCHGKGIKFIREELKFFSKINIQHATGVHFKSIVLFNADCLTIDAQSALRRCIELFSHNTRFFIVVENIHKLLKPIVSRFCEIYVPQIMVFNKETHRNEFINLHRYQIKESPERTTANQLIKDGVVSYFSGRHSRDESKKQKGGSLGETDVSLQMTGLSGIEWQKIEEIHEGITGAKNGMEENTTYKTPADWTNMVDRFYEKGISAINIMEYLKSGKGNYSSKSIDSIELEFHKIKGNYKNEKLLMFQMLWSIHKLQTNIPLPTCE
jgi:hypothetical protein